MQNIIYFSRPGLLSNNDFESLPPASVPFEKKNQLELAVDIWPFDTNLYANLKKNSRLTSRCLKMPSMS